MSEHSGGADPSAEVQAILEEVRRCLVFVPPALMGASHDLVALRAAWAWARNCFVDNPLPELFKRKLVALYARNCMPQPAIVVQCCILHRLGMQPAAIAELLNDPLPSHAVTCERLRTEAAQWAYPGDFASIPCELEKWILLAATRVALGRDPGGQCGELLREVLGDDRFGMIILLASYAGVQRMWCASKPDLNDDRVREEYQKLLEEAPDLSRNWEKAARKLSRQRFTQRERRLMAEIGRQDRIREALRQSERRFRRIVENAAFPLMIYTEDGEVVMLNRAWEELSGWDSQSIPNVQTWMETAQIDGADWSSQDLAALRGWESAIDEGEQRIRTRDGRVRRWNFSTAALGVLADGRQAIMRMAVDVTERRELEDALWDTNRRMLGILDSITDGFSAIDREQRVLYMNDKLVEMIPYRRDEVLGKRFTDVFPVPPTVAQAIERCLRDRTTERIEQYIESRRTYFEMHFYPTAEGLAAFVRDIGQRKEFEQKLAASERRFRSLFESNMLGIMFADRLTGVVVDCNDAMLEIVGYSRMDLQRGRVNWIEMTPPEYRSRDRRAGLEVATAPLVPYEKEFYRKDGTRVSVLIGGAPITGTDDLVVAFVLDRTDRRRLERQLEQDRRTLQSIVRGAPMAIAVVTADALVQLWNPAAEKLLGWTAAEVIGKPFPVVLDEKSKLFKEGIDKIMAGYEFPKTPRPVRLKDGRLTTVVAKAMPARDEQGNVLGAMLLMWPADEHP